MQKPLLKRTNHIIVVKQFPEKSFKLISKSVTKMINNHNELNV